MSIKNVKTEAFKKNMKLNRDTALMGIAVGLSILSVMPGIKNATKEKPRSEMTEEELLEKEAFIECHYEHSDLLQEEDLIFVVDTKEGKAYDIISGTDRDYITLPEGKYYIESYTMQEEIVLTVPSKEWKGKLFFDYEANEINVESYSKDSKTK